ncbi:unnamed protein product (macronuclear) [Paramecium tetraurelia]|uniref:Uncharacterized protein n=1 Tax=Paramecium tetraurelia TaxID=5888 RepID=A0DZK6_PARTE|nr:uncharacterized protein GSPATT00021641001 [Paramecium tetraurelia]CAK88473.1 unnamed protein product [Paramecium tetraurelia]|eukprot:XP_001455870.1 hypothetical protein (macronuclear) [Paramecium tetraurelia strain d4-2]
MNNYFMLIDNQFLHNHVQIKQKRQAPKTERMSLKLTNVSPIRSFHERDQLEQLIKQSIQNPKNINCLLNEFLSRKQEESRIRVYSQPQIQAGECSPYKRVIKQKATSRRSSKEKQIDSTPISPNTSLTFKKQVTIHIESTYSQRKQLNISKLSTNDLIQYHKQLIQRAQKMLLSAQFKRSK